MNIEALETQLAELGAYMRSNAGRAGSPEFRKANLAHRELTRFFEGDRSTAALALAQAELKKIEDGTHPDSLK